MRSPRKARAEFENWNLEEIGLDLQPYRTQYTRRALAIVFAAGVGDGPAALVRLLRDLLRATHGAAGRELDLRNDLVERVAVAVVENHDPRPAGIDRLASPLDRANIGNGDL